MFRRLSFNQMVKRTQDRRENELDAVFHALADRTRRAILKSLAEGERTVSELAEPFSMSLAAVSKHLKVLEEVGLLKRSIDGRIHRCTMDAAPLRDASELIGEYAAFWGDQLGRLEQFFKEEKAK